ncbi:MAG: hypothetical protein WCG47_16340, partial [Dermatophilaceae bacterium]
ATARSDGVQGLRRCAKGVYPLEAAVELPFRAFGGRFARDGYPWMTPGDSPEAYRLGVEQLRIEHTGVHCGGERRLLALAASLAG